MSKSTTDRRREDIEKWKSTDPHHNGWWYYQYFMDSFNQRGVLKRR
tara:strand:+ start:1008 stop:1145 length:138 start_codon:yes stop_codon:yes gene_type:complete